MEKAADLGAVGSDLLSFEQRMGDKNIKTIIYRFGEKILSEEKKKCGNSLADTYCFFLASVLHGCEVCLLNSYRKVCQSVI